MDEQFAMTHIRTTYTYDTRTQSSPFVPKRTNTEIKPAVDIICLDIFYMIFTYKKKPCFSTWLYSQWHNFYDIQNKRNIVAKVNITQKHYMYMKKISICSRRIQWAFDYTNKNVISPLIAEVEGEMLLVANEGDAAVKLDESSGGKIFA